MSQCYHCEEELTEENASKEHIIPNGIGGRLKSRQLLCQTCNSTFGADCDAELVRQLLFLTSHLQVKKERGDTQPIKGGKTAGNQEYTIINGNKPVLAKPVFEKIVDDVTTTFHVQARNEEEMRKILEAIAKKNPLFNLEEAMTRVEHREEYLTEPLRYEQVIGGELAFRSIAKSAISYYLLQGGQRSVIAHLLPSIAGKTQLEVVGHYNPATPPYEEHGGEVLHLLHLVGDPDTRNLYCYLHFFSTYSFIVHLSDQYMGTAFTETYAWDVLQNQALHKGVSLHLTAQQLHSIIHDKNFSHEAPNVVAKLSRVLGIVGKRHTSEAISEIISTTVDEIFAKKFGHEPVITEEMIAAFAEEIARRYIRFWYRLKDQ